MIPVEPHDAELILSIPLIQVSAASCRTPTPDNPTAIFREGLNENSFQVTITLGALTGSLRDQFYGRGRFNPDLRFTLVGEPSFNRIARCAGFPMAAFPSLPLVGVVPGMGCVMQFEQKRGLGNGGLAVRVVEPLVDPGKQEYLLHRDNRFAARGTGLERRY